MNGSAAAGGGGAADAAVAGSEKFEELKTFLTQTLEVGQTSFLSRTGVLSITLKLANGKTHTIKFTVLKQCIDKKNTITYKIKNRCIDISLNKLNGNRIRTYIKANIPQKEDLVEGICFSPLLISDPEGTPNRVTTTDVLQVLKTKLLLATKTPNIYLTDAAQIQVSGQKFDITPYRLLRGEKPFYEKYGYFSPSIERLKTIIKDLTFGDLEKYICEYCSSEYRDIGNLKDIFRTTFQTDYPNETPLIKIMKTISIENDIKIGKNKFPLEKPYSFNLFDGIIMYYEKKLLEGNELYHDTYFFKEDSVEWQRIKDTVLIQDFNFTEEVHLQVPVNFAGKGGRRSRRSRSSKRKVSSKRLSKRLSKKIRNSK
jgi:hypothetical protein